MSAIGDMSCMLYYRFLCVLQIRVHARSFDRCTCLLYYATKFLEMQAEIISFLLIGLISLMRVD